MCDEWVQYSKGTDTVTKTPQLLQVKLPSQSVISGESQIDYLGDIYLID